MGRIIIQKILNLTLTILAFAGLFKQNYTICFEPVTLDLSNLETKIALIMEEGEVLNYPYYRYGPTILIDGDDYHVWFASPGNNSTEWDYIRYNFNFENESIVLKPTKNSDDKYSTCDPGVIYFDGYYYIGYTSTIYENAHGNQVFVARSKNPNGPFEKWNGEGWGGSPKAIIAYDNPDYWGVGEPSFVVVEDKLYMYYSSITEEGYKIKLSIAPLEEDWPSKLEDYGTVLERGSDTFDFVYLDEESCFLAFTIDERMSKNASLQVYQSSDGITFEETDINIPLQANAHNSGVSKHLDGHISYNDKLYICYAFSETNEWGKWNVYLQEFKLTRERKNG